MKSVLAAEATVLFQLKSVRVILLVLFRVIVSLLALGAYQSDLDSCIISHISGTSHFKLFDPSKERPVYLPHRAAVVRAFRLGAFGQHEKAYSQRCIHYITFRFLCQVFFYFILNFFYFFCVFSFFLAFSSFI